MDAVDPSAWRGRAVWGAGDSIIGVVERVVRSERLGRAFAVVVPEGEDDAVVLIPLEDEDRVMEVANLSGLPRIPRHEALGLDDLERALWHLGGHEATAPAPPAAEPRWDASRGTAGGFEPAVVDPRASAWIGEHELSGPRPLVAGRAYTLKLRVGAPVAASLEQWQTTLSLLDIPDEGLATHWTVASRDARLVAGAYPVELQQLALGGASWSLARFELLVPRDGDSPTVDIGLVAAAAPTAHVDVSIDVRGERYRELSLDFAVASSAGELAETEPAAVDDDVLAPAAHLGLHPPHEWQTPQLRLSVRVGRDRFAQVDGRVREDGAVVDVDDYVAWEPVPSGIAGLVKNVRKSAEALRARREQYFDAIDADDLANRLGAFQPVYDWASAPDLADAEHRQAWETVRTSDDLRALAYDGHQLYRACFPDGGQLRGWIDAMRPGDRLDIAWTSFADDVVPSVPWGLMYVRDPQPPIDPMCFLGLRLRLAYRAHRTPPWSRALGAPDTVFRTNLLYWGGQASDRAATEARWQRRTWQGDRGQVFVPERADPDAKRLLLETLARPTTRPTTVLYLYCRCEVGDGEQVVLRFGSGTGAGDVLQRFDLPIAPLEDRPLVFANACKTASNDPYISNELERGFVVDRGARAYIGTEVYVPITLASRLAAVFFHFFGRAADSEPIAAGEALAQTRLFLWTNFRNIGGLFYSYINEYDLYLADEAEVLRLRGH